MMRIATFVSAGESICWIDAYRKLPVTESAIAVVVASLAISRTQRRLASIAVDANVERCRDGGDTRRSGVLSGSFDRLRRRHRIRRVIAHVDARGDGHLATGLFHAVPDVDAAGFGVGAGRVGDGDNGIGEGCGDAADRIHTRLL